MNLQGPSCGAGRQEHVQRLLLECRSRIHAGDAGGAMQCVVTALEMAGGQESVLPTLSEAVRRWRAGAVTASDLNELGNLLSSVSLMTSADTPSHATSASQLQQSSSHRRPSSNGVEDMAVDVEPGPGSAQQKQDLTSQPILAESGRQGLAECAIGDGSSYVCRHCGGVVPMLRQAQHEQFWCQRLHQ